MTLTPQDRAVLEKAIGQLTAVVQELERRGYEAETLEERREAANLLRTVNPELLALRQRLKDLDASGVEIEAPSAGDQAAMQEALNALSPHVAADQAWNILCQTADKILEGTKKIQTNVAGRKK
jgi:hypothetical protein